MPLVPSSAGGMVRVEVKGVAEVQRRLLTQGKNIEGGAERGLAKASLLVLQELQQSIMGLRQETKSVDTGFLANSVVLDKVGNLVFTIQPEGIYPNGQSASDVASFLEYGTSTIHERRHFRNTVARTEPEVKAIVGENIRVSVR